MDKFPKDFLWGTATAGHQVEGNNVNSDWWSWENREDKNKWPLEPSLEACDSYNRYEEDFDLCVQLNNNAARIGIEWARIEPKEGELNFTEIEHYKKVLQAAKNRNLKTFVTLFHFTLPKWLADKGGWTKRKTIKYFENYASLCAKEFGDLIDVYLTINEPQVYTALSYLLGRWPPQKHNIFYSLTVQLNLISGHIRAYKVIKAVNNNFTVGIVKNIFWIESLSGKFNIIEKTLVKVIYFFITDFFLRPVSKYTDLIGLNHYHTFHFKNFKLVNANDRLSDWGWWLHPRGLEKLLVNLKRFNKPIYITEHGLSDANDKYRTWYIKESLRSCLTAMASGVNLKGYFHWSLLDNYEWSEGYKQKFGLVEIERENNLKRTPRASFYEYAKICKDGNIS